LGITLLGTLVTLPQYAQGPLGFTATLSGELILFRALPVLVLTPLGARLAASGKVDVRIQIITGFILIAISNWMLAAITTPVSTFWTFFGPLALSGIGLSQIFVPLSLVVFGSVAPQEVPKASAMFNLARQLGGSLATALLVVALDRTTAAHETGLAAHATLANAPTVSYLSARGGTGSVVALAELNSVVSRQATVLGYADTNRYAALVTIVLAPLSLLLTKPKGGAHGMPAE
jgi:DHA2 family multidrug resistance protein